MWLNGERCGVMVPSGLVGPLRWAADLNGASVRIDGPFEIVDFERRQAKALRLREYGGATPGSDHDDKALPYGTVVFVGSWRHRGTYQSFEKKTFGANEHRIRFDDGSTETLKLKDVSDWRFVRR